MNRSEAGRKGAEVTNSSGKVNASERAQKAAATRKERDPDAFRKMGQIGGSHSHGGGRKKKEDKDEE